MARRPRRRSRRPMPTSRQRRRRRPRGRRPAPPTLPLVQVRDLVKHFPVRGGILQRTVGQVQAVDGVSFEIRRGETLGLVGESGCGKTTVGRLLLRLIEPTSGTITFDGVDLTALKGAELKPYRRRMQIIFQDPYSSLDPRTPIGDSIGEGLRIHGLGTDAERRAKVTRMMDMVGLQPITRGAIRTSSAAASASASGSPGRWSWSPTSSSATSPCRPSTSRSRPRCSTCSRTCSASSA